MLQALNEPVCFTQLAQDTSHRVSATDATTLCASVAFLHGFEFARDVCHVPAQFTEKCLRLRPARVVVHGSDRLTHSHWSPAVGFDRA